MILDQLGCVKYFSVFDLASGFHQIQAHGRRTENRVLISFRPLSIQLYAIRFKKCAANIPKINGHRTIRIFDSGDFTEKIPENQYLVET